MTSVVQSAEIQAIYTSVGNEMMEPAAQPVIVRLAYNSPLEIIFALGVASGTIYVTANRVLSLFEKWQQIRLTRADADMRELAVQQLRLEMAMTVQTDIDAASLKPTVPAASAR